MLLADEFIIDLRDQIGAVFELCCFGEQVARHADKAVAVVHFYALIVVAFQSVFRQRAFDEDMYARTAHGAFGKCIREQSKQFFGVRRENFARGLVHGVVYVDKGYSARKRKGKSRVAVAQAIVFCRFKVRPRFGHIALCKLAVFRAYDNFFALAFFIDIGLVTRPIWHCSHFFGQIVVVHGYLLKAQNG